MQQCHQQLSRSPVALQRDKLRGFGISIPCFPETLGPVEIAAFALALGEDEPTGNCQPVQANLGRSLDPGDASGDTSS